MDCSPPSSSVRGILQARIQEWVAIFSSRGSSLTQRSNLHLQRLMHWQAHALTLCHLGIPDFHFAASLIFLKCKSGHGTPLFAILQGSSLSPGWKTTPLSIWLSVSSLGSSSSESGLLLHWVKVVPGAHVFSHVSPMCTWIPLCQESPPPFPTGSASTLLQLSA